jgi:hypothetical protein
MQTSPTHISIMILDREFVWPKHSIAVSASSKGEYTIMFLNNDRHSGRGVSIRDSKYYPPMHHPITQETYDQLVRMLI